MIFGSFFFFFGRCRNSCIAKEFFDGDREIGSLRLSNVTCLAVLADLKADQNVLAVSEILTKI